MTDTSAFDPDQRVSQGNTQLFAWMDGDTAGRQASGYVSCPPPIFKPFTERSAVSCPGTAGDQTTAVCSATYCSTLLLTRSAPAGRRRRGNKEQDWVIWQ